jgi:hypothetical protein
MWQHVRMFAYCLTDHPEKGQSHEWQDEAHARFNNFSLQARAILSSPKTLQNSPNHIWQPADENSIFLSIGHINTSSA